MVHAFSDEHRRYAVRLLAADVGQLERELAAALERVKRLEEALSLVAKMRADWLEMQDEGYSGAYYAFVKNLDDEWDVIMKAVEANE